MTTSLTRNRLWVTLVAVTVLTGLTATRAFAGDLGKVLGALAVGYVAYEVLDGIDDLRDAPRQYAPPPGPPRGPVANPHRNYDPPAPYYHGGEAKYWYNEGYSDGVKDGKRIGYNEGFNDGYREGDKNGYRRGVRTGYQVGYDDGYDDGHHDGFIKGVHRPNGRRR